MSQTADTPSMPDDRATTFQAVDGAQKEHYSGTVLMVCAYVAVIVLLVAWVALIWRKAGSMAGRLAALEREIEKAAGSSAARDK